MKLRWPVNGIGTKPGVYITQKFGDHAMEYANGFHTGIDIGAPLNTPIYASQDGTAHFKVERKDGKYAGYGLHVKIYGAEVMTVDAHMNKFHSAKEGDVKDVEEGDLIGYVGTTGYSSGYHDHFGARPINADQNNSSYGYVNPLPYMKILLPKWAGYRKHKEKDMLVRFPDMESYFEARELLEGTGRYQFEEDWEYTLPLDKPPFPS